MKEFPKVLEQKFVMGNSALCEVGEHLGFDHNEMCDVIRDEEFFGVYGDSYITVRRNKNRCTPKTKSSMRCSWHCLLSTPTLKKSW